MFDELGTRVWVQEDHRGWGDRIGLTRKVDDSHYDYDGHTTPVVAVGDIIRVRTTSGMVAEMLVQSVNVPNDPGDQWFAKCERIG